jgi:hypothetical protein
MVGPSQVEKFSGASSFDFIDLFAVTSRQWSILIFSKKNVSHMSFASFCFQELASAKHTSSHLKSDTGLPCLQP